MLHQLNDKNWNERVKFDPELLIHYLFDNIDMHTDTDVNVIKVCKIRVTKTMGTMLTHYYAHIKINNDYEFEFHPGSQPRTFQTVHTKGFVVGVYLVCNECCKNYLRTFIEGENNFNVIFKNCETILCQRHSFQTIFVSLALLCVFVNMIEFSWFFIFLVTCIVILLYMNNNYLISTPQVQVCAHKQFDVSVTRFFKHNNGYDLIND